MGSDRIRLRWVESDPYAAGSIDEPDDLDDRDDAAASEAVPPVRAVDDMDEAVDDMDEAVDDMDEAVHTDADSDAVADASSPPAQPAAGRANGGTAVGIAPRFRVDARPHHALVDAITAVAAAAGLLSDRWDDLTDEQRRELAVTIKRRADDVRGCLGRAAS